MGALLAAEQGRRGRLVGRDAPREEIVRAAVELRVDGVAVPIPHGRNGRTDQEERIDALRAGLPHTVALCVGWHGSLLPRRPRKGVRVVRELGELELWLRELL